MAWRTTPCDEIRKEIRKEIGEETGTDLQIYVRCSGNSFSKYSIRPPTCRFVNRERQPPN